MLIFCYTGPMRISEFVLLALFTCLATYWMNDAILTGSVFWAILYGSIVARNLSFAYKVTRFIRLVETATKKKD